MTAAALFELAEPSNGSARIGPREAATLASGVRTAGVSQASARHVVELLLRSSHGRAGTLGITRSTRWIGDELGISRSTARRALDNLAAAGVLVVAIRGIGRTTASYLVNLELLRILTDDQAPEVTPLTPAVHPGASTDPEPGERSQNDPSEGSKRPLRGVKTTPPSARARVFTRTTSVLPPSPPVDTPPSPSGAGPSPAARGEAPFPQTSEDRCPHGRTAGQGGCRACGTTARQREARTAAATKRADLDRRRADQARKATEHEAARAAAVPAPASVRRLAAAARTRAPGSG